MIDTGSSQHYLMRLLAIGNNVSALGAFLMLTQGISSRKVHRLILISSLSCLIILVLFMLVGTRILDFFGISVDAFQIAGGLVLGRVGLDMLQTSSGKATTDSSSSGAISPEAPLNDAQFYSAAVVPIGIPLTVGAGTLSAVVLFAETASSRGASLNLLVAIVSLVIVNCFIFRFSSRIMAWLGSMGVDIFIKLMGLFTLAIGVQFLAQGVGTFYIKLHETSLSLLG